MTVFSCPNVDFTPPSFAGAAQRGRRSAVCHVLLNLAGIRSVFGHPSRSNTALNPAVHKHSNLALWAASFGQELNCFLGRKLKLIS